MTPQEKARILAEAVIYCRENKLLLPHELQALHSDDEETRFSTMCRAMIRMQRHKEINMQKRNK